MAWTPDKIKQLKKLWQKGKSTVEIARELGISKNAVVGKVHRLGLDARPSPIHSRKTQKPAPAKSTVTTKGVVTLMDLKINSCRWPFGDPSQADFHFCGKECQTGKPYCPEHCKQAYTSLKELALESAKEKKDPSKLVTISPEEAVVLSDQKKKKTEEKKLAPSQGAAPQKLEKQASKPAASSVQKNEAKAEHKEEKTVKPALKTPAKDVKKTIKEEKSLKEKKIKSSPKGKEEASSKTKNEKKAAKTSPTKSSAVTAKQKTAPAKGKAVKGK